MSFFNRRRPPPQPHRAKPVQICKRCGGAREELHDTFCMSCIRAINNTEAGFVRGRHYTEYVDEFKQLKREKRYDEAESLLLELIAAVEREAEDRCHYFGAAPAYTEHLAIVYRKQHRYADEVAICERFERLPGQQGAFSDRLPKARLLLAKSTPPTAGGPDEAAG
jgi:hypothetical protein